MASALQCFLAVAPQVPLLLAALGDRLGPVSLAYHLLVPPTAQGALCSSRLLSLISNSEKRL